MEIPTSSTPTGSSSRSPTRARASTRAEAEGNADELSEGGLGIAIIRAIADEVEIGAQPGGKGSRLRFVKR